VKNLLLDTIEVDTLSEATKLVKESVDGFFKLFNSTPSCMSLTSIGTRTYVKVNKRFLEKLKFTEEEVIGSTSKDIGILDKQEADKVASLLKTKGRIENEIIICRTKYGEIVYTISCIEKMEFNGHNYFLASFLDISEIIKQQQIIEQQKKVIEEQKQLVDEAYKELHEKNREMIDSINYAKRIQVALLTSERYIEKALSRLITK
jgi:PAS domain S-box-containing protein